MARIALLLCALVAVVLAQNERPLDDFLSTTRGFALQNQNDAADRTTLQGTNFIQGGEREVYVESITGAGRCTSDSSYPQSSVEGGLWTISQPVNCAANYELRLDGSQNAADDAATRDFDLGFNIAAAGDAIRIVVASDLATSFSVELATSASAVSSVSRQLSGRGSNVFDTFTFLLSEFAGSADLSNIGAISLKFPGLEDVDAKIQGFFLRTPAGSISGSIFEDCNCDGVQEAGDSAVPNQAVSISGPGGFSQTVQTNSAGTFQVGNLASGTYTVSVSGVNTCSGTTSQTVQVDGTNPNVVFNLRIDSALIECPADTSTSCGLTSIATTENAVIVSTCSGSGSSASISFTDSVTAIPCTQPGAQISTIVRTFSAPGAGSCTQTIQVFDTEQAPVLSLASAPDVVSADPNLCTNNAPIGTTGSATASNTCTPVDVTFTDSVSQDCTNDCQASREILRRWTAVDQCGNAAQPQTQRIECTVVNGECPPCPTCPPVQGSVPSVSNVPVTNPPTRNCRFICDDDDSSASILSVSAVAVVALIAVLF